MVREQLQERGITDARVLKAMRCVPRHEFVPEAQRGAAYDDHAMPIGFGQTISQPFIVGFMTESLELEPDHRVLEIGTGCGYQAAVLSMLAKEVFGIEIVEPLVARAAKTLLHLGFRNVHVRCGDGHLGWPESAPFDAIIVTCAPEEIPEQLVEQLVEGGRMMIPLGSQEKAQELLLLKKIDGVLSRQRVMQVRFVPMTGGDS